jgi:photosystem II stability/assembly factor-like uncharacterized protein
VKFMWAKLIGQSKTSAKAQIKRILKYKKVSMAALAVAFLIVLGTGCTANVRSSGAEKPESFSSSAIVNVPSSINQIQLNDDKPSGKVADSGTPTSNWYDSLYFLNDSIGWVVQGSLTDTYKLLSTSNGGRSWVGVYNGSIEFKNLNFISQQVGWAVIQTGDKLYSIDKTTDGGKTWANENQCAVSAVSNNGNINTKVKFFDSNNGYALIYDKLFKTFDGGDTWTDITPTNGFSLTDCSFISAVNVWVCGTISGNIVALNTTDTGKNWTQKFKVASSYASFTAPLKINFISETIGWILLDNSSSGSSKPNLYKTTDGGNSFVGICNVTSHRPYPADICFTDTNIGFVGTDHGAGPVSGGLMMTTDGGKTFSYLFDNIGGIDSIVFPSSEVGYALGYNDNNMCSTGFIISTTDGGKSWHQISKISPTIGICFVDSKNGFGIGTGFDAGDFLKTTDGGATWSYAYTFSPKCLYTADISFVSKTTGYVIASPPDGDSMYNDLYKTTDGGKSWAAVGKVSVYCNYFNMFDENNGIASGLSAGSVTYSKTKDGGKTWTPISINANGDKIVSAFSSPEQGVVACFDYQARTVTFKNYKDGNIGNTIATCPNTEIGCDGICMVGNKVIALMCMGESSGFYESMIISNDNGTTWKQIPLSENTGNLLLQVEHCENGSYIDFPNSKDGFIMVSGCSSLLCTIDGGTTWQWN